MSHLKARETRAIRALFTDTTITVYQAYSARIGSAAVQSQNLAASPDFMFTRMTWIKPSWNWMMYRCGYSYKDPRQETVLAITMKRSGWEELLSKATVGHGDGGAEIRVQWDPERDVSIQRIEGKRSIQVGIGRALSRQWVEEWIVRIEDVTDKAREIKRLIDEGNVEEARKLVPEEEEYPVSEELKRTLKMVDYDHFLS